METVAERVNGSQGRAREAGAVIERIAHDISSVADANQKIDDESKTQLNQLQMLQIRLAGLFESVQQTAAKVENTANVSDDLYRVTESLRQVLSQFTYEKIVHTPQISNEHRVAPRLSHQLRVRFWQSGAQFESICNDLSLSGMKLRIKRELDTKEPIDLEVFLPYENLAEYEAQRPVALRAEVVWQRRENGKLQCGLPFIDLTSEREEELNRCFEYFNEVSTIRLMRNASGLPGYLSGNKLWIRNMYISNVSIRYKVSPIKVSHCYTVEHKSRVYFSISRIIFIRY